MRNEASNLRHLSAVILTFTRMEQISVLHFSLCQQLRPQEGKFPGHRAMQGEDPYQKRWICHRHPRAFFAPSSILSQYKYSLRRRRQVLSHG
jgi:hypothetical protein